MRTTTLAEVISSPTSRKNGIAISASLSIPLNSWPTMDWKVTGVRAVPTSTPAMSEKATGTPRYPSARNSAVITPRTAALLAAKRQSTGSGMRASVTKPWRRPQAICSTMNSTTSAPETGIGQ